MGTDDTPTSISDVVTTLKKKHPKVEFVSYTNDFLTIYYQRTKTSYVKIKLTLTFPNGYSNDAKSSSATSDDGNASSWVVATIEGGTHANKNNVPPGLKRKLEKQFNDIVLGTETKDDEEDATTSTSAVKFDIINSILRHLIDLIDSNLFVPCWKELRQVVELINGDSNSKNKDAIRSMNETKGLIRFTLYSSNGIYYYKGSITIDPEYPNTSEVRNYGKPCHLKLESSNLPTSIAETIITKQGQELIRRSQDGMSEQHAKLMCNTIPLPIVSKDSTDNESETPEQQWQREDLKRMEVYKIPNGSSYDGSHPQLSLLPVMKFLQTTIHALSKEKCPKCNELSFPKDPKDLESMFQATKASPKLKRQRPIRVHCQHWYHHGCMDTLMNEPPFGVEHTCVGVGDMPCGRPLYHPTWSIEAASERERMYHQKQAREREIADVADFF